MSEQTVEEETLQRLRRLETKVHKVASHLGVDVETSSSASLIYEYGDPIIVISGHDVTVAMIKRVVERMPVAFHQLRIRGPDNKDVCMLQFLR